MKYFFVIIISFSFAIKADEKNILFNKSYSKGIEKINGDLITGKITGEEALLQKFYYGLDRSKLRPEYNFTGDSYLKCGTEIIVEFHKTKNQLSSEAVEEIENMISRKFTASADAVYISPGGNFELTYFTSGADAVPLEDNNNNSVPDYVENIASYFDYSWSLLIDTLGHIAPPLGNSKYQIGFENMGYYGYTQIQSWNERTTYIVMHNNYEGFPSNDDPEGNQWGAAKATAVHEFKHAIQFAYNLWADQVWLLEMDATWSEDIGYDYVNDYYNYLSSSHIRQPERPFTQGSGYEDCLWLHYISQKFGVDSNRRLWENIASNNQITSYQQFDVLLNQYGSDFPSGLTEYFSWIYSCGSNHISSIDGFKEAADYPTSKICGIINSIPDSSSGCLRKQLTANFLVFNSNDFYKPVNVNIDFDNEENITAIILLFKNGAGKVEFVPADNFNMNFISGVYLSEISKVIVIPVVTKESGVNYSYIYNVKPFRASEFVHTVLRDTENDSDHYVSAFIETPRNLAIIDSLKLFYRSDSGNYNWVQLTPTGSLNEFAAVIPSQGSEVLVEYYFRILTTSGEHEFYPESAPDKPFSFYVGADRIPPLISFKPLSSELSRYNFPQIIFAEITDNIKVDTAFVEYKINSVQQPELELFRIRNNLFAAALLSDTTNISIGDKIEYRITAEDASSLKNKSYMPEQNYYEVNITDAFVFADSSGLDIPDMNPLSTRDTIFVDEDIRIDDIDIFFKISHNRFSDLDFRLKAPFGSVKSLFAQPGKDTEFENVSSPSFILDQDAHISMNDFMMIDSVANGLSFSPSVFDLNALIDLNAKGKWIVFTYDRAAGNAGRIAEWGLIIRGEKISSAVSENFPPKEFTLYQNYPNPFNPSTTIKFSIIPSLSTVRVLLKVFDILGREVATLVNEQMTPGNYEVEFDGSNLPSGVYFYRIQAGSFIDTKKLILVK